MAGFSSVRERSPQSICLIVFFNVTEQSREPSSPCYLTTRRTLACTVQYVALRVTLAQIKMQSACPAVLWTHIVFYLRSNASDLTQQLARNHVAFYNVLFEESVEVWITKESPTQTEPLWSRNYLFLDPAPLCHLFRLQLLPYILLLKNYYIIQ